MKKYILFAIILILLCPVVFAEDIPESAYGVIYIPCIDVKMPLYAAAIDRQSVIDNENSALIDNWFTAMCITDHAFSKDSNGHEWNTQKVYSGAYAWLYTNTETYWLECYMTAKTNYDGNEYINNRIITPCSSYDIMIACCAEDSDHHFIAVFKRIGTIHNVL